MENRIEPKHSDDGAFIGMRLVIDETITNSKDLFKRLKPIFSNGEFIGIRLVLDNGQVDAKYLADVEMFGIEIPELDKELYFFVEDICIQEDDDDIGMEIPDLEEEDEEAEDDAWYWKIWLQEDEEAAEDEDDDNMEILVIEDGY